jgi:hypothetical protein
MSIKEYITDLHGGLTHDVATYLQTAHNPQKFPQVVKLYRGGKKQEFFYEGTVRAQIAYFLQKNLAHYEGSDADWIVISEQPYSSYLEDGRADILLKRLTDNYTVILEVKADLLLESAAADAEKLFLLRQQKDSEIDEAYVFFVGNRGTNRDQWISEIEAAGNNEVIAIGFTLPLLE